MQGIPSKLPALKPYDTTINHAPKRKDILTPAEKKLALRNALRYFDPSLHAALAPEFMEELHKYGRIYMYRYRPDYEMYARPIDQYPAKCRQAAAIMLMIQNNLDPAVAKHPHELITYGGNGAVFQNWAQYRLVMKYLSEMTDEQTLVMYSGHPLGLFPSHKEAPRVVVTNGMMIPNYSKPATGSATRPRRDAVRPDDRRQLYVHRTAGHCARHHHHGAERRPQARWRHRRQAVRHRRPRRHERRPAQSR